jgi:hypothetical protein
MKSKLGRILVGVAVLGVCVAGRSSAGEKDANSLFYVNINRTNRTATGQIAAARSSPDKLQYIGCWINAYSTGNPANGTPLEADCRAHDATTQGEVTCFSTEPQFISALSTLNSDSILEFDWDANGRCTYVYVETASYVSPKT